MAKQPHLSFFFLTLQIQLCCICYSDNTHMMIILSNIIQSETVRRRRTETNPGFCSDFAKLYQRNGFKSDMLHGAWTRIKHCFSFWRMRGGLWDLCGLLLHCLLCLSLLLTCTNFRGEHPAVFSAVSSSFW